jgi:two-component system nitrate/nitrite response regulator NarL
MDEMRVLIVADDPLARGGLAALLGEACAIVGQVAPEPELLAVYSPDVLLWDLGWEPTFSPETLDALVESDMPIVALLPDEAFAAEIWTAGVRGILPRDASQDRLVAALNAVVRGLAVLDPAVTELSELVHPAAVTSELTLREEEVLALMAEGATNRAIAQELTISEHTVKFHINAILSKLHAQSRTEAVVQAIRLGLIKV